MMIILSMLKSVYQMITPFHCANRVFCLQLNDISSDELYIESFPCVILQYVVQNLHKRIGVWLYITSNHAAIIVVCRSNNCVLSKQPIKSLN